MSLSGKGGEGKTEWRNIHKKERRKTRVGKTEGFFFYQYQKRGGGEIQWGRLRVLYHSSRSCPAAGTFQLGHSFPR